MCIIHRKSALNPSSHAQSATMVDGIAVGLKKGHVVTKHTVATRPAQRKGVSAFRTMSETLETSCRFSLPNLPAGDSERRLSEAPASLGPKETRSVPHRRRIAPRRESRDLRGGSPVGKGGSRDGFLGSANSATACFLSAEAREAR